MFTEVTALPVTVDLTVSVGVTCSQRLQFSFIHLSKPTDPSPNLIRKKTVKEIYEILFS